MEIKVGEKIRCNDGLIGELIRIERDDIDISLKWYVFDDGKNERYVNKPYITKHSFSLTDLIEVGDYINGERILDITGDYIHTNETNHNKFYLGKNIKTILSKEQYQSNCYAVYTVERRWKNERL